MFLMQITTSDFGLQLATEVTGETVRELQENITDMIKANPVVIGMKYIVAMYTKTESGFASKTVKTGTVTGK